MALNELPDQDPALPSDLNALDKSLAQQVVQDALARYFAGCRERIEPFVAVHFSWRGAATLHRRALGWDIAKAPVNLLLAAPQAGLKASAAVAHALGADRAAAALGSRDLLLKTKVGQEVEWLIYTELLQLPYRQGDRLARRDAIAEEVLSDPRIQACLRAMLSAIGQRGQDPAFRQQLDQAMTAYTGTRAAAAEITTALVTLGVGATAAKQFTPGMMTLGPALAAALAQQAAVASFPLGAGLGGLWYSVFPASASAMLVGGLTGGLMMTATLLTAFAGILADPVQRQLGLHQRRLERLVRSLERQMMVSSAEGFAVRDHYVARLFDVFDLVVTAYRLVRA